MSSSLILAVIDGEPRIDSRLVAAGLGVEHEATQRLVDKYSAQFQEFGQLRFENGVVSGHQGGGNPQKFALLNEDQTYFLMTLVRNTVQAVELKKRLVQAFSEARRPVTQTFDIAAMGSMALRELATKIDECVALTARVITMQPKADYFDRLMGTHGTVDLETAAKALRTSRPKLITFLQDRGILTKKCLPAQTYIDRDYMRVQLTTYQDVYGRDQISQKTVITQPGLLYIRGLIDVLDRQKAMVINKEAA